MAAALMRRVISPALLFSSSPRPVRTVAQLLSTRFFRTGVIRVNHGFMNIPDNEPVVVYPSPENISMKDTPEGVYTYMEIPGVSKEDVKVLVDQNYIFVKAIPKGATEELAGYQLKMNMIELVESGFFDFDAVKAEMKSGVLQVFVPFNEEGARKKRLFLPK